MKFRVTSITGSEEGPTVNVVTVELEDALNAALSDQTFGSKLQQMTVVLISAFDDYADNQRWAKPHCKLGSVTNPFTKKRLLQLSFGVPVERARVLDTEHNELRLLLAGAIMTAVATRPKRIAAGLDYAGLSQAVQRVLRNVHHTA